MVFYIFHWRLIRMSNSRSDIQRAVIAAGGIFYNVQPGTAAQLKI